MDRIYNFKALLILLSSVVFSINALQAQNIVYKARVDQLRGGVSGDCLFCGGPDNDWTVGIRDNSLSTTFSTWNKYVEDDNDGWRNYSNSGWRGNTAAAYGTTATVGLTAFEEDGGGWGGSSDGSCGSSTLVTVSTVNITNDPPCAWKQYEGTRSCSGALWGIRYSLYWEYDVAPTISAATPTNQIKCS